MDVHLPKGLFRITPELVHELQQENASHVPIDKIIKLYQIWKKIPRGSVGNRLEYLFWRIWSSKRLRKSLRGLTLAQLFERIDQSPPCYTFYKKYKRMNTDYLLEQCHLYRITDDELNERGRVAPEGRFKPRERLLPHWIIPPKLTKAERRRLRRIETREPRPLKFKAIKIKPKKSRPINTTRPRPLHSILKKSGSYGSSHPETHKKTRLLIPNMEGKEVTREPANPLSPGTAEEAARKKELFKAPKAGRRRPAIKRRRSAPVTGGGILRVPSKAEQKVTECQAQQEASQESAPKESFEPSSAREESPELKASQQLASQKMASQKMASQNLTSHQSASQELASQAIGSLQSALQELAIQESVPPDFISQEMTSASLESGPQQFTPQQFTPQQFTPQQSSGASSAHEKSISPEALQLLASYEMSFKSYSYYQSATQHAFGTSSAREERPKPKASPQQPSQKLVPPRWFDGQSDEVNSAREGSPEPDESHQLAPQELASQSSSQQSGPQQLNPQHSFGTDSAREESPEPETLQQLASQELASDQPPSSDEQSSEDSSSGEESPEAESARQFSSYLSYFQHLASQRALQQLADGQSSESSSAREEGPEPEELQQLASQELASDQSSYEQSSEASSSREESPKAESPKQFSSYLSYFQHLASQRLAPRQSSEIIAHREIPAIPSRSLAEMQRKLSEEREKLFKLVSLGQPKPPFPEMKLVDPAQRERVLGPLSYSNPNPFLSEPRVYYAVKGTEAKGKEREHEPQNEAENGKRKEPYSVWSTERPFMDPSNKPPPLPASFVSGLRLLLSTPCTEPAPKVTHPTNTDYRPFRINRYGWKIDTVIPKTHALCQPSRDPLVEPDFRSRFYEKVEERKVREPFYYGSQVPRVVVDCAEDSGVGGGRSIGANDEANAWIKEGIRAEETGGDEARINAGISDLDINDLEANETGMNETGTSKSIGANDEANAWIKEGIRDEDIGANETGINAGINDLGINETGINDLRTNETGAHDTGINTTANDSPGTNESVASPSPSDYFGTEFTPASCTPPTVPGIGSDSSKKSDKKGGSVSPDEHSGSTNRRSSKSELTEEDMLALLWKN